MTPITELNRAYCIHCGARNELLTGDNGDLPPCMRCGKQLYDLLALLAQLKLVSATMRMCPACRKFDRLFNFCFYCGAKTEPETETLV